MTKSTQQPTGGIDDARTLAEITDAFGRKGIELAFRPVESGWEAVISAQSVETLACRHPPASRPPVGPGANTLKRNGGTGES